MPNDPAPPRAALYVDFDNVFMALLRWDERAAYAFGERPDAWLAWLEGRAIEGGTPATRRTLVRRCYLNPAGYHDFQLGRPVARYRAARDLRNRAYFSEFRAAFVAAGFDVVDCPAIAWLKNSADMKMALDIREALDHRTRFEEFVLLSGDSDFLPALARLRAFDRRITVLAQDTAKAAYLAAADLVVGLDEFAHAGMGDLPIAQFSATAAPLANPAPARMAEPSTDLAALRAEALDWVRDALARSPGGVLRLTDLGQALPRAFPALRGTDYAGAGSLGGLIEAAQDPRLLLAGAAAKRILFDPQRAPEAAEPRNGDPLHGDPIPGTPPAAEQVSDPQPAADPMREVEPVSVAELSPEAAMAEAAQLVRDLLWGSRDPKGLPHDLPAFTPAELGFVLNAIAAAQPLDPSEAALEIAADAAEAGLLVSAREVMALMRWLMRGYVKLNEAAPPEGAARLARALFATLVNTVRALDEKLSESETESLRAWTQNAVSLAPDPVE